MKDAVEPTALLLEDEEEEPELVVPVPETEDWGAEKAVALEPVVPEPESEPTIGAASLC